jgi:hypothetical protein
MFLLRERQKKNKCRANKKGTRKETQKLRKDKRKNVTNNTVGRKRVVEK